MLREQFEKLIEEKQASDKQERLVKGSDYARPDQDVLSNFKEVANRLEGAPMDEITVWAVYFEKHVFAIERYIRDRKLSSEPVAGRFKDARNYLYLGEALIDENKETEEVWAKVEAGYLGAVDTRPGFGDDEQDVVAPPTEKDGGLFKRLFSLK